MAILANNNLNLQPLNKQLKKLYKEITMIYNAMFL
jgi:hypothetical protein